MSTPGEIMAPGIWRGTWRCTKWGGMRAIVGSEKTMVIKEMVEGGFIDLRDKWQGDFPMIYRPVIFTYPWMIVIHETVRIDSFVKVEGGLGVRIGRFVHVASFAHLNIGGGELILEEGSAIAGHVSIITGTNSMEGVSCSKAAPKEQQVVMRSKVVVKKNAVIFVGGDCVPWHHHRRGRRGGGRVNDPAGCA